MRKAISTETVNFSKDKVAGPWMTACQTFKPDTKLKGHIVSFERFIKKQVIEIAKSQGIEFVSKDYKDDLHGESEYFYIIAHALLSQFVELVHSERPFDYSSQRKSFEAYLKFMVKLITLELETVNE